MVLGQRQQFSEGVLTTATGHFCCYAVWLPLEMQGSMLEPRAILGAQEVRFCPLGHTLYPLEKRR